TLAGAALKISRRYPGARVLGALHGVRGVRDGRFVTLSALSEAELRAIASTPGAALGSTRDKPDAAYCDLILKGLRAVGADAFIYIGGNDTAGTQEILAEASGERIVCVHAPKTIDNDLVENDHTPGFISAAEFVAGALLSVDLDFRALRAQLLYRGHPCNACPSLALQHRHVGRRVGAGRQVAARDAGSAGDAEGRLARQ